MLFVLKKTKSKIQKQKFMLFVLKEKTKSKTQKNQNLCFLFFKMQKPKVYIFLFFSLQPLKEKAKGQETNAKWSKLYKRRREFYEMCPPWTWFKVEVLRSGVNLGATEIEDSLQCKSFFRFYVCFSFLLSNLTMTM